MRARSLVACLLLMVLPLAAHARKAATPASRTHRSASRISVAFDAATVEQAVRKAALLLPGKPALVVRGDLPRSRVSMRLTNVEPGSVLRTVCMATGLTYQEKSAGGKRVIVVSPTAQTAAAAARGGKWTDWWPPTETEIPRELVRPRFNGDGLLVDLQVNGAPLEEAVKQLARASGYRIHLDPAVPNGITVTANVRKMPIGGVLSLLAGQTHLAYSVTYVPSRRELEAGKRALDDARGEVEAAEQRRKQAEVEAELAMGAAQRQLASARRAVEQATAEADVAKAKLEAGVTDALEFQTKQRALADAQDAAEEAAQVLEVNKQMAAQGELTSAQVVAAQALRQAGRKLEQAEADLEALAKPGPGTVVAPAADSAPIIYLVPVPELRATGP